MYLCLKILVKPIHFFGMIVKIIQNQIFMQIDVTSAKQCDTIITCFKADVFSPDFTSYIVFLPFFFGQCWYMSVLPFPHSSENMLLLHSVSSINMFCCICFEVIIQELSNQSLIILSCGGSTIWMGSNLINTTFLVFIPLMTSAIPSEWLTSRSGFWYV